MKLAFCLKCHTIDRRKENTKKKNDSKDWITDTQKEQAIQYVDEIQMSQSLKQTSKVWRIPYSQEYSAVRRIGEKKAKDWIETAELCNSHLSTDADCQCGPHE